MHQCSNQATKSSSRAKTYEPIDLQKNSTTAASVLLKSRRRSVNALTALDCQPPGKSTRYSTSRNFYPITETISRHLFPHHHQTSSTENRNKKLRTSWTKEYVE